MQFIELPIFEKYLHEHMNDDEYSALQWYLAQYPETGVLIKGGGGIRKMRWGMKGKGKRGSARIIYYYYAKCSEIFLMLIYSKNEMSDISAEMLKRLRKELPK